MEKIFKLFLSSSGMWKPAPRIITSQRGIMFPLLEFRNQKDKCPTEVSPAWSSKKWRPDVASWMFITIILTSHVLLALRFSHGERKKVTFFKDCLQHSLISFYQKSTQRIKKYLNFSVKTLNCNSGHFFGHENSNILKNSHNGWELPKMYHSPPLPFTK